MRFLSRLGVLATRANRVRPRTATTEKPSLQRLGVARFGSLTQAEAALLQAAETGDETRAVDYPWDQRAIRVSVIRWLCLDPDAKAVVHTRGISVEGARFEETLDLSFTKISFPLAFRDSDFSGAILLDSAEIPDVDLSRSTIGFLRFLGGRVANAGVPLSARAAKIANSFKLADTRVWGQVRLSGAQIGMHIDCAGAELRNRGNTAFAAETATVGGDVLLLAGVFEGKVSLFTSKVGRNFDCSGARFKNPGGTALSIEKLRLGGGALLAKSLAFGEVNAIGAQVDGNLECDRAVFSNGDAMALVTEGANIKGACYFRHAFRARGQLKFWGAKIGGDLDFTGACLLPGVEPEIVQALGLDVGGSVLCRRKFRACGKVSFVGAKINGNLECDGSRFDGHGGVSLTLL